MVYFIVLDNSGLAQLVEHTADNREVIGSKPISTTRIIGD